MKLRDISSVIEDTENDIVTLMTVAAFEQECIKRGLDSPIPSGGIADLIDNKAGKVLLATDILERVHQLAAQLISVVDAGASPDDLRTMIESTLMLDPMIAKRFGQEMGSMKSDQRNVEDVSELFEAVIGRPPEDGEKDARKVNLRPLEAMQNNRVPALPDDFPPLVDLQFAAEADG